MRLFGLKLQGGHTSESRTFARLLGGRGTTYDAHVLYHAWAGNRDSVDQFAHISKAEISIVDVGLRSNDAGRRSARAKMVSLIRFRATFPRMVQAAKTYNPDIIYSSQQLWDCAAASHVAARLKKAQVIHLHFNIGPRLHTGFSPTPRSTLVAMRALHLQSPLDRLLTCDHVATTSEFVRGQALEFGVRPDQATTVLNPVPPVHAADPETRAAVRRELSLPMHSPVIGIVGRLDRDKGQLDTLLAFAKIAEARPLARLLLVGDGPMRAELQKTSEHSQASRQTLFTGYRTDVPRLLSAMDIFAHPSRREPFGMAMAEASSAGLPVVAYDEGGACEIVEHGTTGLLAPPGDVDTLAAYLSHLLDVPATANSMGMAGRRRISALFRPEDTARAFAELLLSVVRDHSVVESRVPRDGKLR